MEEIGSYEAKTKLPALLARVEEGEEFMITRHGKPVARLTAVEPVPDPERAARIDRAIEQLRELRKHNTLDGISARELIEEGRRF